jgi:NitT/TauT family transport system substrate-binding protein
MKLFVFMSLFFSLNSLLAQTPIQIALNWKAEPQFGGFYQAYLNKELPLQIIEGGSGTPTVQMLSFGKINYAVVSAEEILISNDHNPENPLVAVFAVFQTNPQVWITRKDRGLKSIGEILSHPGIVAAQSGLTYVQFLKKKYPQNKVQWVPYTGGISGLELRGKNYTQQGFLTSEPLLAEKAGVAVASFLIADEGFNPYTTVLAVRKSDLAKKKTEITKVVAVVKKGWQDYLKNPMSANQYMGGLNKSMDAATFQKSADLQKNLIQTKAELGSMTEARWNALIQTLVDLKVISHPLKALEQYAQL